MSLLLILSWSMMLLGLLFFIAGSIGLLRFPDQFSRLHAVTKADTLGLGLVVLGLSLQSTWRESALMLLIWLLLMMSGAVSCQLLARFTRDDQNARNHKAQKK
ncbi:monovalent cation/H(+) antiporter subunit G [Alishewanella longhuensis]